MVRLVLNKHSCDLASVWSNKESFLLLNFEKLEDKISPQMYEFRLSSPANRCDNYWSVWRYKNMTSSCVSSSSKNLSFKFSNTSEQYTFEQFYNFCVPNKRILPHEKALKKFKRKNKSRNGSKDGLSTRNARNQIVSKTSLRTIEALTNGVLQTQRYNIAEADKENMCLNVADEAITNKPKIPTKGLKLKKNALAKSDIKNIAIEQIKLHKTFVNHRGNTLAHKVDSQGADSNQIEDTKLNLDHAKQANLKLMKDLGIRHPSSDSSMRLREAPSIGSQHNTYDLSNNYHDKSKANNKLKIDTSEHYKQGTFEGLNDDKIKMNQLGLKRENSLKSFYNQPLWVNDLATKNNAILSKNDNDRVSSTYQNTRSQNACDNYSKSVKLEKTKSASSESFSNALRWISPDIIQNNEIFCDDYFGSTDDIHASPNTKKFILKQAQDMRILQNQIFQLQQILCGMVGDKVKLVEIMKCEFSVSNHLNLAPQSYAQMAQKSSSSSCSRKFNPMNTPKDFNCTPTSLSLSNLAAASQLPIQEAELDSSIKPVPNPIPKPPNNTHKDFPTLDSNSISNDISHNSNSDSRMSLNSK